MIFAAALFADAVARQTSRRVWLLTALVWWTMPLVAFISRQLMTDGPFVSCLMIALACVLRAAIGRSSSLWWAGAFAAMGFGLLAKGLMGLLPLVLIPTWWLAFHGREAWSQLKRVPWWGPAITGAIAGPWYMPMLQFSGRDEEGRLFAERFLGHDHFDRLFSGVYSSTPGGTFTYFIEQGAFALAPWVVLLPVALTLRHSDLLPCLPRARLAFTTTYSPCCRA